MAIVRFGNTWWGNEWLNAFNNIYDSNRLPRGQTYARNGSVVSLNLTAGEINAQVQGSRPRPYKIKIGLPLLNADEQQTIINVIVGNPYYLAQLLSSKLPPELNQELIKHKIYLFPMTWKSFNGDCSCPDYANPCKHLAAIIYQIANKIDLNPFVIFKLKGFDLLQQIRDLYGLAQASEQQNIINYSELLQSKLPSSLPAECRAGQIDFSQIPNLTKQVLCLLPDSPLFALTINYKQSIIKHYRELSKQARLRLTASNTESDLNPATFIISKIHINPDLSSVILLHDHNKTQLIDNVSGLIKFIQEIPNLTLSTNSVQLNGLYLVFHLCRSLVVNGAIIPQLYELSSNTYMLRYVPLLSDENVATLVMQVSALLPENLISFGAHDQVLSSFDQCIWLLSLLIKELMYSIKLDQSFQKYDRRTHEFIKPDISENSVGKVDSLFLSDAIIINPVTEAEFIKHIQLWLGRFTSAKTNFVPLLQVVEDLSIFKFELLIKDISQANLAPISLRSSLLNKDSVVEVLQLANLITEYVPSLSSLFSSEQAVEYTEAEFLPLFFEVLPVLKLIGVDVLLPKGLKNLILPKLSVKVNSESLASNESYFKLDDLLDFDWQISLGSQMVSADEFKQLVANGQKLVKLKDGYVYLDQKLIDSILNSVDKPIKTSSGAGLLRDLLAGDNGETPFVLNENVKSIITKLLQQEQISLPENLQAQLRDYQYQGYCWLYRNIRLGFGSVIADDMGLGKTLQVISCILKLKQENIVTRSLIVVPTSLLTNWSKELQRFAPDLSINTYHGKTRDNLSSCDITLITYGMIRRDIEKINQQKWDLLVIDEAQNIKNVTSQQSKLVKSIKAKHRIAMSGTPVENRLLEYYSIMDFANKGYLGGVAQFNKQFAKPIEVDRDLGKLNKFLFATKPFVLRRLKSDKSIIRDLPDKIVIDEYCDLTKSQTALYQATLNNIMKKLKAETDEVTRRGLVLTLILALKQICNHPSQYLKLFDKVKIEESGKLMLLLDKIHDIHANNEKVLIFTQFAEMGKILQTVIEQQCNSPVLFLHGATSRTKRDEMVELIQTDSAHKTLILSIKAGGVGLNLTGANHVIHYDLWWNPAVENQATDRAYRIGQDKNVFVHRLVCSNSFEEKINQMIKDKQELANLTVATGEQWVGNLSDKELGQLFKLN